MERGIEWQKKKQEYILIRNKQQQQQKYKLKAKQHTSVTTLDYRHNDTKKSKYHDIDSKHLNKQIN